MLVKGKQVGLNSNLKVYNDLKFTSPVNQSCSRIGKTQK